MSGYRARGALSRAILQKFQNDKFLDSNQDELITSWYRMDRELPAEYQEKFTNFLPDQMTMEWLEQSRSNTSIQYI